MKIRFNNKLFSGFTLAFCMFTSVTSAASEIPLKYQGIPHDSLYDLCFNGDKGFAVGSNGLVLETMDGGQKWQQNLALETKSSLLGVDCLGDKNIAVGQEGSLFLYEDNTWVSVDSGTDERLFSVTMNEAGLGFAVGGFGTIIKTVDGGKHWEALEPNWEAILNDFVEPHLYDVSIGKNGVVTLIGEFEMVLRSKDMGKSWSIVHKGDSSLFSIHFSDELLGYAVGQNGRVLKTENGGEKWSVVETNSSANLLSVWSSTQGEVLVTGIRTLLRSSDGASSWSEDSDKDIAVGWYNGIAMASKQSSGATNDNEGKVYAVGHMARIIEIFDDSKK